MIVVILITESFRQADELENLRVAFGNEKKKVAFQDLTIGPPTLGSPPLRGMTVNGH